MGQGYKSADHGSAWPSVHNGASACLFHGSAVRCILHGVPNLGMHSQQLQGADEDNGGLVGEWPYWWFPTLALLSTVPAVLLVIRVIHEFRHPVYDSAGPWWVTAFWGSLLVTLSVYFARRSIDCVRRRRTRNE